jgi:hypothetical protein
MESTTNSIGINPSMLTNQLERRIDDLQKNKVSSFELECVRKDIHNIHLDLAFIKGVLSGITTK